MKNTIRILGIIALVVVIGFSFIACSDGNNNNGNNDDTTHTHAWGAWAVTTPATCTTAGEETRVCSHDATHVEKQPISALGHDYEWAVTTPATYFVEGVETETCNHDASHTNGTRPYLVPFTDIATFATELAKQPANPPPAAPYSVRLNVSDLGGAYNTAGSAGAALSANNTKYVSLDLSGSTFTSIGDAAFRQCTSLTSVTIGNSVTSIGENAFSLCFSLASVTIPNSVTSIGANAFYGCPLASITIPNRMTSIEDGAFSGLDGLLSVTIPNTVTSIGDTAFAGCTSLTSVTFAAVSNIASFGNNAFPEGAGGMGGNTLRTAYQAANPKAGTYTRTANGTTWTRQ